MVIDYMGIIFHTSSREVYVKDEGKKGGDSIYNRIWPGDIHIFGSEFPIARVTFVFLKIYANNSCRFES